MQSLSFGLLAPVRAFVFLKGCKKGFSYELQWFSFYQFFWEYAFEEGAAIVLLL